MTRLAEIEREYTLAEIAIMTRAAPAKLLGLADRGDLSPGEIADVAVYRAGEEGSALFGKAAFLYKDGHLVVRDGSVVSRRMGRTLTLDTKADPAMTRRLERYYDDTYGIPTRWFQVPEHALGLARSVRGGSMAALTRNGVVIDDTFAEAFPMSGTGIVITAGHERWVLEAARSMTGFATSVIACGVEAGIDRMLSPEETPDGRPGVRILIFGIDGERAEEAARDARSASAS